MFLIETGLSLPFFRFLTDTKLSNEIKRFSAEGLSYLTFDADVKDYVVQDESVIRSLVTLAKVGFFQKLLANI